MEKPTSHAAKRDQSHDNSTAAQCDRLEAEIRRHPVSTIYARDKLDILMPAARVFQLRYERGLNIHTHWKTEPTACGKDHRVAEYVLLSGKWKGEAA
jgi:hypothetical protein